MKPANEVMMQRAIPQNWLPLLELAVREVFEIMLGSKLELVEEGNSVTPEFTAMVGLAGQLCGVLTLKCSTQSAALMTSKMLGGDPKDTDEQMWDALGEVCNMIAGNFKNKLTGMADQCMLSVPTVVTGADYSFHSLADAGSIEVRLKFEGIPLLVTLEIHS
jgi:chemotaxis protein CheX